MEHYDFDEDLASCYDKGMDAAEGSVIPVPILNEFYRVLCNSGLEENALGKDALTDYFKKYISTNCPDVKLEELYAKKDKKMSFTDFVYADCMMLRDGAVAEFRAQKDEVDNLRSKLAKKRESIASNKEIKKDEKDYWNKQADIIQNLIDKKMTISYLVDRSINKCRKTHTNVRCLIAPVNDEKSLIERKISDLGRTWRELVCFGGLSIEDAQQMLDMRKKNYALYISRFRCIVCQYLDRIIEISNENYYVHRYENGKCNILSSAKGAFETRDFVALFYILIPQVEGLFKAYAAEKGFGNDFGSLGDVLRKMYPDGAYWEYVYYYFVFRNVRNSAMHGNEIDIKEETSYEIVMALYCIVQKIDDDSMAYKQWTKFLKDAIKNSSADSAKVADATLSFFTQTKYHFESSIDALAVLDKWIKGGYNDIMKFRSVFDCSNTLKSVFSSQEFLDKIWKEGMPIEIETIDEMTICKDELTEKQIEHIKAITPVIIRRVNDSPLKYRALVRRLYKNKLIPPDKKAWRNGYFKFCADVDEKLKEYDEKIKAWSKGLQ